MSDSHYNTPPDFLRDYVRPMGNGIIGLDPCSNADSFVKARRSYDVDSNGLVHPWRGHGLVFMNPPHSMAPANIEPWILKFQTEFCRVTNADQFLALVPAKTDTSWFHGGARSADRLCFLRGRMRFWLNRQETTGAGKFAHLVIYRGDRKALFDKLYGPLGYLA